MSISAFGFVIISAMRRVPRRRLMRLPELSTSNMHSIIASERKTKTIQRQRFIFLEVYRVQLGQVHDQRIQQVSNDYAYKFPFKYLDVGNRYSTCHVSMAT